MQELIDSVMLLADDELQRANKMFPAVFNSNHEGISVLDEEVEELTDEFEGLIKYFKFLKRSVYRDDTQMITANLEAMERKALLGCAELIQVVAMILKFRVSREERKRNGAGWEEEERP